MIAVVVVGWSWESNPDSVVEMASCRFGNGVVAPTVPVLAQWAASSGEVGRCVEHFGRARGADPRCSCAAEGWAGEENCR